MKTPPQPPTICHLPFPVRPSPFGVPPFRRSGLHPLSHSVPFCHSVTPPHLTFRNLCYIAKLEVYMVNSPSRLNSRPADPPSRGGSVRHIIALPLPGPASPARWGRPVPTAGYPPAIKPNQTKSNHPTLSRISRISRLSPPPISETRTPKSVPEPDPIKAKTPVIVRNQGKSSLIKANAKIPERARPRAQQRPNPPAAPLRLPPRAMPPLSAFIGVHRRFNLPRSRLSRISRLSPPDLRNPKSIPEPAPIKAKTPVIVHNQGKSSLIKANAKCSITPGIPARYSPIHVHPRSGAGGRTFFSSKVKNAIKAKGAKVALRAFYVSKTADYSPAVGAGAGASVRQGEILSMRVRRLLP